MELISGIIIGLYFIIGLFLSLEFSMSNSEIRVKHVIMMILFLPFTIVVILSFGIMWTVNFLVVKLNSGKIGEFLNRSVKFRK